MRAAIKDVGRTLGFSPAETDALAKLIPNAPNFSLTVKEAIEQVPEVKSFYQNDERYRQLLDFASNSKALAAHRRARRRRGDRAQSARRIRPHLHDASRGPVAMRRTRHRHAVRHAALEKAGMLKMDFLRLTTLTVITDTLGTSGARRKDVQLEGAASPTQRLPVLRAGRTGGVFQFESPLARMCSSACAATIRRPRGVDALLRPGPLDAGMHNVYIRRKRGDDRRLYALPELEPILSATYGVITYQEQVMRIAQVLAGISLAEADVLRKAVGKKDAELIKKELGKFTEKAIARGYDPKIIEELAGQIETFGRYGFNKSHSVAYSVVRRLPHRLPQDALPGRFMAAPRCCRRTSGRRKVIKYIAEAREMGIGCSRPT